METTPTPPLTSSPSDNSESHFFIHTSQPVIVVGRATPFTEWLVTIRQSSTQQPGDQLTWFTFPITTDQDILNIDQVRELQRDATYSRRPNEGRDVIISNLEKANVAAQNALLKLLEEPPPRTKFWLLTTRPSGILETIQSRALTIELASLQSFVLSSLQSSENSGASTPSQSTANKQEQLQPATTTAFGTYDQWQQKMTGPHPGPLLELLNGHNPDRDQAVRLATDLLQLFRTHTSPPQLQQHCLDAVEWLENNANVGLTLDNLAIQIWKTARHPE